MTLSRFEDVFLILLVLLELLLVELLRNFSIDLVIIERIEPFLGTGIFLGEVGENGVVVMHLIGMTLFQGFPQPLQHFGLLDYEKIEDGEELIIYILLSHELPLGAVGLIAGAMIVRMAALLLGGDRTPALAADHEILEEEIMLAVLAAHFPLELFLHTLEELLADERFMFGLVELSLPEELPAAEKGVTENIVDDGLPDALPVLRLPAFSEERFANTESRVLAGVVELEGAADEVGLRTGRVDHPNLVLLLTDTFIGTPVIAGIPTLIGLFRQPLLDLLGQVIAVLAGEHDVDVPLELLVRLRVLVDDEALLHEVDLPLLVLVEPLVQVHGVPEVASSAINLFEDQDFYLGMGLAVGNDFRVDLALDLPTCGLGEDETLHDLEIFSQRVIFEQFHLRGEGVALVFLIFAGDAGDENGGVHGRGRKRFRGCKASPQGISE